MKKTILFLLSIVFIFSTNYALAQWINTNSPFQKTDFLAADGSIVYAGTNQGIFVSPNEGNAWIRVDPSVFGAFTSTLPIFVGNPFSNIPLDSILIAVDSSDISFSLDKFLTNMAYYKSILQNIAASGTKLLDTLKFSFDYGQTWVSFKNLPDGISIYAIAADHSGIYIGTNQGIFKANPHGTSWTSMNSGLTNTIVHAILALDNIIFAGTEGGVFYDLTYSASPIMWHPLNDGLTNPTVMALAHNDMQSIYAGTDGGGIFIFQFIVASKFMTWQPVNTGLSDLSIISLADNEQYLFAGTKSSGVWKRPHIEMFTSVSSPDNSIPARFKLEQNYPNPFNPTTTINFTLAKNGKVSLKVFDILGREVATLVNEELKAGVLHQATFNASRLASGLYFYRLDAGSHSLVKKLVLMK